MYKLKEFESNNIPIASVAFAFTEEYDYSATRTLFLVAYPNNNEYTLVEGGHCSCYGFDEVEWEAIVYTEEELLKVLRGWMNDPDSNTYKVAKMIVEYMGN